MYKNIAATLQTIERVQRHGRDEISPAPGTQPVNAPKTLAEPGKLGPLQKIIAFGPLI